MLPDYIYAPFWTDKDMRQDDIILEMLKKLISHGEPFVPDKMYLSKETRQRYVKMKIPEDFNRIQKAIRVYEYLTFGFMKEDSPYFHFAVERRSYDGINPFGRKADPNCVYLQLESHLFNQQSIVQKFLEVCKLLYEMSEPYYGYAHDSNDANQIDNKEEWSNIYHTPQFCMVYWANFFGPSVVENYGGKEKFLKAPCWKVEELKDGGILLLLYPDPLHPESEEKREIQNKVLDYFGLPIIEANARVRKEEKPKTNEGRKLEEGKIDLGEESLKYEIWVKRANDKK